MTTATNPTMSQMLDQLRDAIDGIETQDDPLLPNQEELARQYDARKQTILKALEPFNNMAQHIHAITNRVPDLGSKHSTEATPVTQNQIMTSMLVHLEHFAYLTGNAQWADENGFQDPRNR